MESIVAVATGNNGDRCHRLPDASRDASGWHSFGRLNDLFTLRNLENIRFYNITSYLRFLKYDIDASASTYRKHVVTTLYPWSDFLIFIEHLHTCNICNFPITHELKIEHIEIILGNKVAVVGCNKVAAIECNKVASTSPRPISLQSSL